jgi:hypothetical protein
LQGNADSETPSFALSTIYVFSATMQFWGKAFDQAYINTTSIASKLLNDFPLEIPLIPQASEFLTIFSSVLGVVGSIAGTDAGNVIPEDKTEPKNEEPDAVATSGSIISALGGFYSLISSATTPSSSTPSTATDALTDSINSVFTNARAGVQSLLTSVLVTGDLSGLPSQYTTGTWKQPIANFFDNGNFLYVLSNADETYLATLVTDVLQATILGSLLTADNWWISQDAYTQADCVPTNTPSAVWLNGHCYTLETFDTGYDDQNGGEGPDTYSVPADSDMVTKVNNYLDLTDLYESSVSCQAGNANYGGDVTLDYEAIVATNGAIPSCFYSLPVFYVSPTEDVGANGVFASNPCIVLQNNLTATTQVAGLTYLPANLDALMGASTNYCCVQESKEIICAFT